MRILAAPLLLILATVSYAQVPGMRPVPQSLPTQGSSAPASPVPSQAQTGASQSNVVYGKAGKDKLRLDVYRPAHSQPAGQLHPAIILIHGGAWMEGDKTDMSTMARWLAKNGFVAFSINYRLFDSGRRNTWPVQLDDAQRAVRWIRANAQQYEVDPAHVGAYGYSAGAQMAALLGMVETRDNSDAALSQYSSRVQAVTELAGPADLLALAGRDGDQFLTKFIGGSTQALPDAWRSASPAQLVGKDDPPFLIFHGASDKDVPIGQSLLLAAVLQKAGVPVTLIKVDDDHSFSKDATTKRIAAETLAFFKRTLG